jgi:hypothetical protein
MNELYRQSIARLASGTGKAVGEPQKEGVDAKTLAEYERLLRQLDATLDEQNRPALPTSAGSEDETKKRPFRPILAHV